MLLAPLRGVTIRAFRRVFSPLIRDAGFTEAVTPFVASQAGFDALRDREISLPRDDEKELGFCVTPQFIGKDPRAFRETLMRVKAAGYDFADLNAGCPYPMIRGKGRGSGLLRTPEILREMLRVGCEVMGANHFSVKTRLGIDSPDELANLMAIFNAFPLRFLTVHARTARQMYEGTCARAAFAKIQEIAKIPLVENGDLPCEKIRDENSRDEKFAKNRRMVGRAFIRDLGFRDDIGEWLDRYVEFSRKELCGERPVLGRLKELLAYWREQPRWRARWQVAKMARSLDEIRVW